MEILLILTVLIGVFLIAAAVGQFYPELFPSIHNELVQLHKGIILQFPELADWYNQICVWFTEFGEGVIEFFENLFAYIF